MTGVNPTAHRSRRSAPMRWFVFLVCLNGCFTWHPAELTPAHTFKRGEQVRIERSNGRRIVLLEPKMAADTVVGHRDGSMQRLAIPLADVRRAERLHFNGKGTALSLVIVAALLAAVAALALSDMQYMGSGPIF